MSNHNRIVTGDERRVVLRESARTTTLWRHKSATGTRLRAVVLDELSAATRAGRHVNLQVELLDPGNELACGHYRDWARHNLPWSDPRRQPELEVHATVLALCLERKTNNRLRPDVRFCAFFDADQLDLSDGLVMLTRAQDPGRTETASLDDPLYHGYVRAFDAGWIQAARLRLQAVRWSPLDTSGPPAVHHVRNLFKELDLPGRDFTDEELRSIVERLDIDDGEGDDPRRGVDSA